MAGRISYLGGIVTRGLILDLDAAKRDSYVGTGTAWNDISGNQNNGTLINGPTFNSSNGGSIVFDGSNDYVETNNTINISSNQSRTIDVWIYLNNSTTRHVLCSWGGFGQDILCNLEVNQVVGANTNYPYFAGFNNDAYIAQTISLNTWTNLTLTYDTGTINSSNGIKMYINGLSKSVLFPNGNRILNTTNSKIYIGYEGAGSRNPMNGRVANCKIYNRALSASEILQNYNATKTRYI
ncbi:Concanavalin A-like lectin/glucanases superfamily [uncultured Caudovirales phage]|uniref:Concanavalin A-like lectin/glucanases superfamily n=1 Tax=uncultured Caudovirales phage TaxID=2100421 RepID=A0A6J5NT23_9CAUD|nr:Concanavalin A-like lectin/glucanases superfamily [uncultured Caudovirales phage]